MELSEQLIACKAENENYKKLIDNVNAINRALDQMFMESIKNSLICKKELFLSQDIIQDHVREISILKNDIESLRTKINELTKDIIA